MGEVQACSFTVDAGGFVCGARLIGSPNFDERPEGAGIDLLVIHNISLPPGEFGGPGVISFFNNRLDPADHPYYQTIKDFRVSSHLFIRRDGELIQFVSCLKRAWHAGLSSWRGRERCNDFSIGVELEGADDVMFTDRQYHALGNLTLALMSAYPIQAVVGHSDISPGRKSDPGPFFEWTRYRSIFSNKSDS
ncbi:MAG: 1,6-anhydro-N-acetylmuramyl-L-alanine amidase AmpD [Pseudomonadota bacterium]|nr:1,6-anhydro-N-acetylmuramyl-L-alanine amidase AmpD [Pseudomonadota bacterium]